MVDAVLDALPAAATTLRPVLNATGVLLHTNLGRAPLSAAARAALDAGRRHLRRRARPAPPAAGARGARAAVDALLAAVPGAGAAHLVNNGAAALALVATALAARPRRSSSPAVSWSRSATGSASPTCSPRPAPGCARSAPPTG